jgi:exopolysaccharide biosynthesis polyprenyl glycosylphosphotransferase
VNVSGTPAPELPPAVIEQADIPLPRRVPHVHRVLTLPPYDVRLRRELAQRRLLVSIGRQVLRVASLHVLDAIAIGAATFLATEVAPVADTRRLWPSLIGLVLIGLNANSAYKPGDARRDARRLLLGVGLAGVVLAVVAILPPSIELPLAFLPTFLAVALAALIVERWLVDLVVRQAYAHGIGLRKALIVGRHSEVDEIVTGLKNDLNRDHRIIGYVTPSHVYDSKALGSIDDLDSILDREDAAELILAGSLRADVVQRVADACIKRGTAMIAVPSWGRGIRGWAEPVKVGGLPGYHVHPARLGMPALVLKRATDLVLTTVGLVACAPLMGLIALAIKIDSRGPVFFRQRRVGLGGRDFMMWKFRSMTHEAEMKRDQISHLNAYADGRLFKLRDDPRVTRVGRVLRRFSLDELPQLLNVLAGEMSLVGPRPPVPAEVGRYEPRHFVRLSVVPGLTGPWQVGGRNLITDFEEVVRLEREYIDGWSLRLDLRIMAKTLGVVLSGRGAY